jgi:tRNA A37 methylthiotransferase MiaB
MRQAAAASAQAFRERYIGEMMDVLWESSRPGDSGPIWSGLTDNYLRVRAVSSRDLANQLLPTKLVALTEKGLQGQIDPEC